MKKFIKNTETILKISDERKQKGDLVGAISVLLNDCLYSKKDAIVYKKLGELYILTGDYDSALNYFLKYVEICPKNDRGEGYKFAGIASLKSGKKKLAFSFFNEQWECDGTKEYNYSDDVIDFLNEMDEIDKRPQFSLVKQGRDCELFEEASGLYFSKEYEHAFELFSQIKKDSKYYSEALFKSALSLFMMNNCLKAVKKFEEFFNEFSPTVEQYCCFINVLNVLSEEKPSYAKKRDLYLNKLYSKKITDNNDNYYVAEFALSLFGDYERAIQYINVYLKKEPYDDDALFMKGMCLFYSDKKEEGVNYIKKAYLLTHHSKYKFFLTELKKALANSRYNLDKVFLYPETEIKRYEDKLKECLTDDLSLNSLTEAELLEIVDFGHLLDSIDFWELVVKVLSKGKKKYFTDILADILLGAEVDVEIKSIILENLVYSGYNGYRGIMFFDYFTKVKIYPANFLTNDFFKRAYSYAFGRFPMIIDKKFIEKVKKFEVLYLRSQKKFKLNDLAGAIFLYCNDFGKTCNAGYFRVLGTNKKKSKEVLEEIKLFSDYE